MCKLMKIKGMRGYEMQGLLSSTSLRFGFFVVSKLQLAVHTYWGLYIIKNSVCGSLFLFFLYDYRVRVCEHGRTDFSEDWGGPRTFQNFEVLIYICLKKIQL